MSRGCHHCSHCPGCHEAQAYVKKKPEHRTAASTLRVAFTGNPNCGKTTAFNYLTGSREATGNRPGVTVDVRGKYIRKKFLKQLQAKHSQAKHSQEKDLEEIILMDIPGVYSLHTYTPEEAVAAKYLQEDTPHVLIHLVDASNLERALFLTYQLLDLGLPVIVALNMMDEAKKHGHKIDTKKLSEQLGVPVMETNAFQGKGLLEILEKAIAIRSQRVEKRVVRGSQRKVYAQISTLILSCVEKGRKNVLSDKVDSLVLNGWMGIPIFLFVLMSIFWLTFGPFGSYLAHGFTEILNVGVAGIKDALASLGLSQWVIRLLSEGVLDSFVVVFSFIPQILLLFFWIAILEDSGYISRVSFVMDAMMRRFGLGGRSFIAMVMGFGCTVPAILATRTIPDWRDRMVTALSLPFISCGARLPVYALLAVAFFQDKAYWVIAALYFWGIFASIFTAYVFKHALMQGETASLIFELPPYRWPGLKSLGIKLWEVGRDFVSRLATVILAAGVVIWMLQNLTLGLRLTTNPEMSIAATIGTFFSPVFAPLGFGDWQRVSALMAGLAAKETVIAAFEVIYGSAELALTAFHPASAMSFMVFVLLYVPCIASITALSKELGNYKLLLISLVWQFGVAWVSAYMVYQLFLWMGG